MDKPAETYPEVFDYILSEEIDYKTRRIPLADNWDWNMHEHVEKSFMLKNSQFTKGANDFTRPFKNIIVPIQNVTYRTEGFDVKDVQIYVNSYEKYHQSLLARKFHTKWARKYSIDTAIDESVESYSDYGLTLVMNVNQERPEIIPLQQIAFCDQTDVMSGPICLKFNYSIGQLLDMKGKWDANAIDKAIFQSKFSKTNQTNKDAKTSGKYVEVYFLHGMLPESWLGPEKLGEDWEDTGKYVLQNQVITYYVDQNDALKKGIQLFKGKTKPIFKALRRDTIFGRACGRGGIEELFHPQTWTNYSEIHLQGMLEATSKVILETNNKKLKGQKLSAFKQGQVIDQDDNTWLRQVEIAPFNKTHFDNYVNMWEQNARTIGSASDPQLGLNPVSGTPLGTTEIVTSQGQGIHEYRRGQIATFWGEIYRDWVFDYLVAEMNKGDEWLDELTLEELQEVAERVSNNLADGRVKELILSGKMVSPQDKEGLKQGIKEEFMKGGKKRFLKIMKNEFAKLPLEVDFSIAGKQSNLAESVSKLNSVFRSIFANPQILQAPGMAELFNQILESSGISPIDFTQLTGKEAVAPPAQPGAVPSPFQNTTNNVIPQE